MCRGDFHFIEKANGIKYLYAWLDRHPQEYSVKPSRPWLLWLFTLLFGDITVGASSFQDLQS